MKKLVELVKDISKVPKGKAVLFFCGYLLFFICVFLLIKFFGRKDALIQEYEKGNTYKIKIDSLAKNNFTLFKKEILLDNSEYNGNFSQVMKAILDKIVKKGKIILNYDK